MSCSQMLLGCGLEGWTPAQLANLAAWYEAGPEYCWQDGAAQFTAASSQFLSCASNSSLQTGEVDFWWAGWVWLDSLAACRIAGKWGGSAPEWSLIYQGGFKSQLYTVGGGYQSTSTTSTVSTGAWHFLMVWYSTATGALSVKLDSSAAISVIRTGALAAGSESFVLSDNTNGFNYHNGRLDSVCFGKSPPGGIAGIISTISSRLYNSGSGLTYADLTAQEKTDWGLVSFWNLNESSGTRNDSHGTNHLTDNNSVGLAAGIAQAQCGDGDPIALWTDRSGNAYNLTQSDPLKRATLRLVSGKWVSLFDGINDTMECAYTHSGSFTMGMGVNLLDPGNYPMVFVLYDSQTELRSESTQGKYSINGVTSLGAYIVNDDLSLIGVMNATGARAVYVDGAEYGTATAAAGAVPANTIRLGTRDGTLYPANMRTGTVVLTTSVIDSNTIAKMSNYIANRLP